MAQSQWQLHHQHGKARVRLGHVWRENDERHSFVEWTVAVSLSSHCDEAFTRGDNSAVVATDTIKNTIYWLAKESKPATSLEDFGVTVAQHFVTNYSKVTGSQVSLVEMPWERVQIDGVPHNHGFRLGSGLRTAKVVATENDLTVESGLKDLSVLKTTQSGFENFIHDRLTVLPDVKERMLASSLTATWRYSVRPASGYSQTYKAVQTLLLNTFFGPPEVGVYSPSVQNTLFLMAEAVMKRFLELEFVHLKMPNLHFLPVDMPAISLKFEHDIYMPTDEPHGTIEASLTRNKVFQSRL